MKLILRYKTTDSDISGLMNYGCLIKYQKTVDYGTFEQWKFAEKSEKPVFSTITEVKGEFSTSAAPHFQFSHQEVFYGQFFDALSVKFLEI